MITDERTAAYIDSLATPLTPALERLEAEAKCGGIPIIRKSTQSLLRFILSDVKPARILELGTATGFSAIFMATYSEADVHIDTVENYALDTLSNLSEEGRIYDMIFMDAAKAQYLSYLPLCKKMLREGGVLVADNVLFDGDIVQSRFAVRRRDRTIHARMRQFLRAVSEDEELVTTILPVGDGMTLSILKREQKSRSE